MKRLLILAAALVVAPTLTHPADPPPPPSPITLAAPAVAVAVPAPPAPTAISRPAPTDLAATIVQVDPVPVVVEPDPEPLPTEIDQPLVIERCSGFHTADNGVDLYWIVDATGGYIDAAGSWFRFSDAPGDCAYARCWLNSSPPPYETGPVDCPWPQDHTHIPQPELP